MTLSHANDRQDESINVRYEESDKRDDSEEISAIRIGNGTKSRLISFVIPSYNHEAKMNDGTSKENSHGLLEWQGNNDLEDGNAILKRHSVHRDELRDE